MRSLGLIIGVAAMLLASVTMANAQGGRMGVAVSGLRSDAGNVRCGLYASSNGFPQPGRELRGTAARISGNQATCVFANVPPGTYAVAAFHAEQNERQMQFGAFGKPKQGYGFSGNPSSSMGPPSFSAAAFDYKGGNQTVDVRLQY
jgi:uncharacterized protein (DUF2141 family)